ncbi:prolactin-releasing peptide isoform X2 [Erinaceus europaeus]|uniref:Prolactin-releasing peptide isoform X2 n=1 Tax=Erinaceus europaeus TaxID=9365 RepID=A0A1S3WUU7_ERIEU|nr:prolactin-releasing peptide isoform X2 [Erinaceus europaeus]XP_060040682.1 prolactin-releasing peptide isoform X2 [Erinaceus europaeus]
MGGREPSTTASGHTQPRGAPGGCPRWPPSAPAAGMEPPKAWLLLLLLLHPGTTLWGAANRAPPHSMETRTPNIDPAWYTARGIRPVGRFGRKVAPACIPKHGAPRRLGGFLLLRDAESPQDG